MNGQAVRIAVWERTRAALRVVASFVAGIGLGSLLLLPVFGPIAMIFIFGAMIFGFPSLLVLVALRATFHRTTGSRLLACCLVAPFLAVAIHFVAQYLLIFRERGFDPIAFLSLPQNPSQAGLALFYASISVVIFYLLERPARRQASS